MKYNKGRLLHPLSLCVTHCNSPQVSGRHVMAGWWFNKHIQSSQCTCRPADLSQCVPSKWSTHCPHKHTLPNTIFSDIPVSVCICSDLGLVCYCEKSVRASSIPKLICRWLLFNIINHSLSVLPVFMQSFYSCTQLTLSLSLSVTHLHTHTYT